MKIRAKLLSSFLLVSLLTLGVEHSIDFLVQEKVADSVEKVGEDILPGNVVLGTMTSELYHSLYLLSRYSEQRDEMACRQIEKSLASLGTFKVMHEVFHTPDDELKERIEKFIEEFSRSVTGYLLLLHGDDGPQRGEARKKIDAMLEDFVLTIQPHIDKERSASFKNLAYTKEKNRQTRKVEILSGGAILLFALLFSFFIAHKLTKPLRTLSSAVREVGAGRLDLVLPVSTRDEVSELTREFNEMAGNLSVMQSELVAAMKYADSIINYMADALVVLAPSGVIQRVNNALCDMLGYQEGELNGHPVQGIVADALFQGLDLVKLISWDVLKDVNMYFLTKQGERIRVSISGSAMRGEDGKPLALILVVRHFRKLSAS